MQLWGQESLSTDRLPLWGWPSSRTLHWLHTNEGANGRVRFLATVQYTGDELPEATDPTMCRVVCFQIISRLREPALRQAFESLADIYRWQIDQTAAIAAGIPELPSLRVANVRDIERPAFEIEDF